MYMYNMYMYAFMRLLTIHTSTPAAALYADLHVEHFLT